MSVVKRKNVFLQEIDSGDTGREYYLSKDSAGKK